MADEILKIDSNNKSVSGAVTDDANKYIKMLRIDDTTKALKVMMVGGAGTGTVTSVSIVTANGISGTVATATTTPAITLALGAITPSTVNGLTITANGTNTLNITAGKTLTVQDNVTITGALGTGAYATIANYALVGQTMYIGTTAVAINRTTGALVLTGITSIDGTATNLSGTPALPNGTTATTQSANDNSTKIATTAYADLKLPLAGGTMTGKIVQAGVTEVGKTYTPASGAQTVTLDCSVNNQHIVTGNAGGTAITFAITGDTNSQPFIVSILQGASTLSTITAWMATVRWAGGTAPTLTATANKRDTFGFIRTGANTYDGFIIGQNC